MLKIVSLFLFSHPSSSSEITNAYFFPALPRSLWDLSFLIRDKTLMVEAWSLNHWTPREVLQSLFL